MNIKQERTDGSGYTMRRKFCMAVVLLGIGVSSLAAQPYITVKKYHEWKTAEATCKSDPACAARPDVDKDQSRTYIKGIGDGFVWANGFLQATNRDRLYCTPENLGLNAANYDQILESFLPTASAALKATNAALKATKTAVWKSIDEVPIGFVLLEALIDSFPCAAQAK